LSYGEIVKPLLAQQPIQSRVERVTRAVGKSVVVTHIAGCCTRLRVPIAMLEV
jgi:hypothetical protein